jgi:hypothetical protein
MTVPPNSRSSKQAEVAERRTAAMRLHIAGHTYQQIADRLGYKSAGAVGVDIQRAMEQLKKEQHKTAEERRDLELARLDEIAAVCHRVMLTEHVAHSGGKIVERVIDGQVVPLVDSAPSLAAADRLIKVSESRRKLLGVDAPARQEITGETTVHYRVVGVSAEELDAL